MVERQSAGLLGRHGVIGTEDGPGLGEIRIALVQNEFGEPEIEDLGASRRRDHDVAGLEIAMDDAMAMGLGQPLGDLAAEPEGLRQADVPAWISRERVSPSTSSMTIQSPDSVATMS